MTPQSGEHTSATAGKTFKSVTLKQPKSLSEKNEAKGKFDFSSTLKKLYYIAMVR